MQRTPCVIGNWKMFKTIVEAKIFVSGLAIAMAHTDIQVGLAVPFTMLSAAAEAAKGTAILIGAQNVHEAVEGPFTGEISARQLKDAGASFVLIGHSERRLHCNEDNERIGKKIEAALKEKLKVVLCIGETSEQNQAGDTLKVLEAQICVGLRNVNSAQLNDLALSYEPVWAIGTGKTATPEVVEATHQFCREVIARLYNKLAADRLLIQYGGSVNLGNALSLMEQPDVDGLLIGGASLNLDTFTKIIYSLRES